MTIDDFKAALAQKNIKLYILSILIGGVTGLVVVAYRISLGAATRLRLDVFSEIAKGNLSLLGMTILSFIGIAIILNRLITKYPLIKGSGLPQVRGILLMQIQYKWFKELIYKFIGGVLSVGSGLSLGRGGPSIHLGSQVAYAIRRFFPTRNINKKFLISSGVSAGLSAAFNSPLSGIVFTIEEIHKYLTPPLLICISLAGVTAEVVTHSILGKQTLFHFTQDIPNNLNFFGNLFFIIILAFLLGLLGVFFTTALLKFQKFYSDIKLHPITKSLFVFAISIITGIFLLDIQGVGYQLILRAGNSSWTFKVLFLLLLGKFLFTILSNAPGFPGGLFLPTLVIGALAGYSFSLGVEHYFVFANSLHQYFMVLGMAAFFTAVMRAPLTANILLLETTGSFNYLPNLMLVTLLTYIFTEALGIRSITSILYDNIDSKEREIDKRELSKNTTIFSAPVFSHSTLDGKIVSELDWGDDTLLIKIQRGDYDIIPKPTTKIQSGDLLFILTTEARERSFKPYIHNLGKIQKDGE